MGTVPIDRIPTDFNFGIMSKIFLLIDGPIDDPVINAAFTSRTAAEAALRFGDDEVRLHELELDGALPLAPPGHSLWVVQDYEAIFAVRVNAFLNDEVVGVVRYEYEAYQVLVWAKDEEHARSVGIPLIRQAQANG